MLSTNDPRVRCVITISAICKPAEPYLGPWVTALVSASTVGAIGLFFVTTALPHWHEAGEFFFSITNAPLRAATLYLFLAQIPLAIALLVRRRWFTGLPRGVQRTIGILWLIFDVAAFVILVASFTLER